MNASHYVLKPQKGVSSLILDDYIKTLHKFGMVDYNTRNNNNKVEFLVSIYNKLNSHSITSDDFITALDRKFMFKFEVNNECEFFSKNITDDAYVLADKISVIIEEESNRYIESSAFSSLSFEKIDENNWDLIMILQNKHKFQEEFTVNIHMTRHDENETPWVADGVLNKVIYDVLITSWERTE